MVKYSIDAGLLGPLARISLAIAVGLAFHLVAIWLRIRTGQHNDAFAALAGGASITLFAAILAALHLYQLWPSGTAFVVLVIVALATMALALLHGPVLAGIGILGAYLVPILVNSGSNNMLGALVYNTVITASALTLMRFVFRPWLWFGTLAGALGWWALSLGSDLPTGARLVFLFATAYGFIAIPTGNWRFNQNNRQYAEAGIFRLLQLSANPPMQRLLWAVLSMLGANILSIGLLPYEWPLLYTSLLLPTTLLWFSQKQPAFRLLAWLGFISVAGGVLFAGLEFGPSLHFKPLSGPLSQSVALLLAMLAGLHVVGASWAGRSSSHKGYWASLTFLSPVAALAIAYCLITALRTQWQWAAAAIMLGGTYMHLLYRQQRGEQNPPLIATLIIAAHLTYSLAVVMLAREATLTLALAGQVMTLVWLDRKFQLPVLGYTIKIVLAIIITRLTLNPWLFTYSADSHWSLWVCGGSCVAVWIATKLAEKDSPIQQWLQGAALHLLALTFIFETRYQLYDGDIFYVGYSFLEAALNTSVWGLMGTVYLFRARSANRLAKFYRFCGHLLLAAAAVNYGLILILLNNPLWHATELSSTPIVNLLLLAYGAPILLCGLSYRLLNSNFTIFASGLGAFALLYFVSIEIRHLWQGQLDIHALASDGEHYTYSMAWLLLAVVGTVIGIRFQREPLYKAAMVLLMFVVGKIFIFDMSGLTSLWRVASFMGLGLCLLGLAYVHQTIRNRYSPQNNNNSI